MNQLKSLWLLGLVIALGPFARAQDDPAPKPADEKKEVEKDEAKAAKPLRLFIQRQVEQQSEAAQKQLERARATIAAQQKQIETALKKAGQPLSLAITGGPEGQFVVEGNIIGMVDDQGLGLRVEPADETMHSLLKDIPKDSSLVVRDVDENSRASAAGIQKNDILLKLNDEPLVKPEDIGRLLEAAGDKPVKIVLLRAGKEMTVEVPPKAKAEDRYMIGVNIGDLDGALRAQLGLPEDQGVIINEVLPDTPAAAAGLKPHDILLKVGDKPVKENEALVKLIQENQDKAVELKVLREGKEETVSVTPKKQPVPMTATATARTQAFPFAPGGDMRMRRGLRFMGPGVFIGPDGRPAPAAPGQPGMMGPPPGQVLRFLGGQPSVEIEKRLDKVMERLDAIQKDLKELQDAQKK